MGNVDVKSTYFMDSVSEVWRLERKTDIIAVGQHLLMTGLRTGMNCIDVACGSGIVARLMAKMAGPDLVVGVDQSTNRLEVARTLAEKERQSIRFVEGWADHLPLADESSDFTHARMLFQYLSYSKRIQALREMARVTRLGGRVIIVDLDQQLTRLYPMPKSVRVELRQALTILRQNTGFDPNVGRKISSEMREVGLKRITTVVEPYQCYQGGALPERDRANWEEKMGTATAYLTQVTGEAARWERFRTNYLQALQAPNAFYCADVIITSGIRE